MWWRGLAVVVILQVAAALQAAAESTPSPGLPDFTSVLVTDLAGVIDPDAEARIAATLRTARTDPGTEIAVATIRSRAAYGASGTLASFATRLFNHWGVGDPTRNDGILVLVVVDDREMRIALGAGYDPVWDGRAQRVIDALMLPAFRDGDYAGGIEAGVQGVIDHIARPFRDGRDAPGIDDMPQVPGSGFPWEVLIFVVAGAGMFWWKLRDGVSEIWATLRPCPSCGGKGVTLTRDTVTEAGEDSEGRVLHRLTCPNCGWHRDRSMAIPSLRAQRETKSSSSFGGGRSSGGGASGRW
jgi:uncharacterized protein